MAQRRSGPRHLLQLATLGLLGGSVLLASVSGDPLLLLAVLSATTGLIVLSRPAWMRRPVAISAVPGALHHGSMRDAQRVPYRSPRTSPLMAQHTQRLCRPGPLPQVQPAARSMVSR